MGCIQLESSFFENVTMTDEKDGEDNHHKMLSG